MAQPTGLFERDRRKTLGRLLYLGIGGDGVDPIGRRGGIPSATHGPDTVKQIAGAFWVKIRALKGGRELA